MRDQGQNHVAFGGNDEPPFHRWIKAEPSRLVGYEPQDDGRAS